MTSDETVSTASAAAGGAFNVNAEADKLRRFLRLGGAVGAAVLVIALGVAAWRLWISPYGKVVWQVAAGKSSGPARYLLVNEEMLVAIVNGELLAVAPRDGHVLWRRPVGGNEIRYARADADGFLLQTDTRLLRLDRNGEVRWEKASEGSWRLQAHSPSVALLRAERVEQLKPEAQKKWLAQFRNLNDAQRRKLLQLRQSTGWGSRTIVRLAGLDMEDGHELWGPELPAGMRLIGVDIDATQGVLCLSLFKNQQQHVRLLGFAPETGKKTWTTELDQRPLSGPVCGGDNILWLDGKNLHVYDRNGKFLRTAPWSGDEDLRHARLDAADRLQRTRTEVALWEPDVDKPRWTYNLAGGILDCVETDRTVVVTGHTTTEGGAIGAGFEGGSSVLGLEGPLKNMVASSVSVADFTVVALDRRSGSQLWEIEDLTGDLVGDDTRLAILADSAKASLVTRSAGKSGLLVIHQLDPRTGRVLSKRRHDAFRLEHPVMVGDRVVALAYPRTAKVTDAACTGLVALRLK